METRTCTRCGLAKTIRGVWYILPDTGLTAPFLCESCFRAGAREPLAAR